MSFPPLARDDLTQPHECLDAGRGVLKQVVTGTPLSRLPKQHNRGATETERRFLVASLEGLLDIVLLHDAPNGERADFNHSYSAEIGGLEDLNTALVFEQDVGLILQRVLVDGPQSRADAIDLDCLAIVDVVKMM
jgi:hypothetical protein